MAEGSASIKVCVEDGDDWFDFIPQPFRDHFDIDSALLTDLKEHLAHALRRTDFHAHDFLADAYDLRRFAVKGEGEPEKGYDLIQRSVTLKGIYFVSMTDLYLTDDLDISVKDRDWLD